MTEPHYTVPPIWLLPDYIEVARFTHRLRPPRSAYEQLAVELGVQPQTRYERRHAVDGDCWCGTVHLAMESLTLDMLREFRDAEMAAGRWKGST